MYVVFYEIEGLQKAAMSSTQIFGGMTWWLLALSKVLPTKFCAMPMMVPCSEASPWWYALLRSVAGDGGDGDHGGDA